jgi:DNA primase
MERDRVSFTEAVRALADRAGIVLPSTPEQRDEASEQEILYQLMREAALYYHRQMTETTEGKFALEYFHRRGFSDDTIRTFGLGYSPKSWDALLSFMKGKGFAADHLKKCGLVRVKDDGSMYDYFRGRAMFPVFSGSGRVIAFGARKIYEDDPLGKYINSPETPIYSKSRVLYGLSQAKESIREREQGILVEGYADLISVVQAGVPNIVASSGTALTVEQIQLLRRYANRITIVYDADSAGSAAALRGVDLILQSDMEVRVAPLPEGDDPDSFVRKNGGEAFQELVNTADTFIDFLAATYERRGDFKTPEGQAGAVRAIVRSIAKMSDELKRNFYIKEVANKYKLYESTLYRELEKHLESDMKSVRVAAPSGRGADEPPDREDAGPPGVPVAERDLLHAMLDGGIDIVKYVFEHVQPGDFTPGTARALASYLLDRETEGLPVDPAVLMNELASEAERRFVAELLFNKYHLSKKWEENSPVRSADVGKIASDALRALQRSSVSRMVEENQKSMKEAGRRGEDIVPYLERHRELIKALKDNQ